MKSRKITSKIKTEIVLKHLRGEELELLSREYAVSIIDIQQWRDVFITNGLQGLKQRPQQENKKLAQAERKIGQLEMEIELIKKKNLLVEKLKKRL